VGGGGGGGGDWLGCGEINKMSRMGTWCPCEYIKNTKQGFKNIWSKQGLVILQEHNSRKMKLIKALFVQFFNDDKKNVVWVLTWCIYVLYFISLRVEILVT